MENDHLGVGWEEEDGRVGFLLHVGPHGLRLGRLLAARLRDRLQNIGAKLRFLRLREESLRSPLPIIQRERERENEKNVKGAGRQRVVRVGAWSCTIVSTALLSGLLSRSSASSIRKSLNVLLKKKKKK
jgi:hypothetical protein